MSKGKLLRVLNFIGLKISISLLAIIVFFILIETILGIFGFERNYKDNREADHFFKMGQPLIAVDPVIFLPDLYTKDKLLFWKLKPFVLEEVNNKKYRGPERSYDKPVGTYRIIVLGDSCAYGISTKYKNTYSHLIEEKLNSLDNSKHFEVINAGVPGYSSLQGLRYLKYELIKYNPDMVLVGFGFNDLVDAVGNKDNDIRYLPLWVVSLDNKLSKTRFYIFFKRIVSWCKYEINQGKKEDDLVTKENISKINSLDDIGDVETLIKAQDWQLRHSALRRVPPKEFVNNIKGIIDIGRRNNFEVILLTLPSISGCFGYGHMLKLIAKIEKIGIIDLIREFKIRNANRQKYFIDNNHYNNAGHSLIADVIYEKINFLYE